MAKKENRKKKNKLPKRKHRFYCGIDLDYIDMRTTLGQTVKALRQELRAFVGEANVLTDVLCHRIIYKAIKLSMYETAKLLRESPDEAKHYLPMANSLRLDLLALSNLAGKPQPPDLNNYLKEVYGSQAKHNKSIDG